jgi:phosphatidylglycerol lysyltransferase
MTSDFLPSRRARRRVVATTALVFGIVQMSLAADEGFRSRAGFLGIDWVIDALIGTRYVVFLAGLVVAMTSVGLAKGKRNAWLIAVIAAAVSLVAHHATTETAASAVVSALFVALLIATRSWFHVRSDPRLARRGWQVIAIGGLAVLVYGTVGLFLLDRNFRESTSLVQSAQESVRLLFLLSTSTITPINDEGQWFIDSVRGAAIVVLFLGLTRVVTGVLAPHRRNDATLVRQLLDDYGTTGLAYFQLLDDKQWFISEDRRAFIGYKVVGTTAVALGEPVGPPDAIRSVTEQFVDLCESNGWTYAFHQVTGPGERLLAAGGLRSLKIGEEAVVPVQTWDLQDKQYKSLRSALRRVERAGLRVEELASPIDDATMDELRAVSDDWLADGEHRERTFTVGRFDPAYLRETTVLVVREAADATSESADASRIVAFANVLPHFRSVNGNFDLMRRRHDAPNGVMEALFITLIHRFKHEGRTGMYLGLAPFSNITGDSIADRFLRSLYQRGDRAFNYQGLRRFKEKWNPGWEDRFLVYNSDIELPKIAVAVSRAGELPRPLSVASRFRSIVKRFPVSIALVGLILWMMIVTRLDPAVYDRLLSQFGLRWSDLTRLQVWRLGTSQLMQDRPGIVLANVALCVIALPVAEWTIKSRRTAATFFLGDWASTLIVLFGLRIAAGHHSTWAANELTIRDAGPSAGAWALVVTVAMSLENRVARVLCTGAAFGFLTAALVVHHRLFDIQHFVAGLLALAAAAYLRRRARRDANDGTVTPPDESPPSLVEQSIADVQPLRTANA